MSTTTASNNNDSSKASPSQYYHEPTLSFEKGLIIAVSVMGLLMCLVVLRFLFNVCVEFVTNSDDNTLGKLWRCLCPWWRPRTNPEQQPQGEVEGAGSGPTAAVAASVDDNGTEILQQQQQQQLIDTARTKMSPDAWKAMIHSILPSKNVTAQDLATWKKLQQGYNSSSSNRIAREMDQHDDDVVFDVQVNDTTKHHHEDHTTTITSSSDMLPQHYHIHNHPPPPTTTISSSSCCTCNGIVCSICLHDIEIGDSSVTSKFCQHVFHQDCILNWLQRSNWACPYCRVDMISRAELCEAIRIHTPKYVPTTASPPLPTTTSTTASTASSTPSSSL